MKSYDVDWTEVLVRPDASLRDVVAVLDRTGLRIVLVHGPERQLLGTITDGDLRRALLRGDDMSTSASDIMFTSPVVVDEGMTSEDVLSLMRINKLHQLPVVDAEKRLIGLHIWDDILAPSVRDNTVVIMAGGFGTRMGSHTRNCPKPMLKVHGKPMLEHIIVRAAAEGFRNLVISLFYLPDVIRDYFGNGSKWNVRIAYVEEEAPLGTAGALSLLDPKPTLPFIVTNGDVLSDVRLNDMLAFHKMHEAAATMAVRQHEWQHPFGVVKTQGIRIKGFEEKPVYRTHVNAGIYVLEPAALSYLAEGTACDMPALFDRLQDANLATIAYPMHEVWMDVGRPEDLVAAHTEIEAP